MPFLYKEEEIMTMMQIVQELISQGHQVDVYIRKDGGILIKSIDGQRFSGAKGNTRAREMTGQKLSEARFAQLKFATGTRKQLRTPSLKKTEIKDAINEEFKRVKKIWNKAFKARKGKPHPAGYFTKARIKKAIRDFGEEEALRRIGEAEKYATGVAYDKNVKYLVAYIRSSAGQYESQELASLADDIEANAYAIREEWIVSAYDELYKLDKGVSPQEVASMVRKILRLVK